MQNILEIVPNYAYDAEKSAYIKCNSCNELIDEVYEFIECPNCGSLDGYAHPKTD